jgi:hypothetical protein
MDEYGALAHVATLEIGDNIFEVLRAPGRLVFGGACNAGFLESGYMDYSGRCESDAEALEDLEYALKWYYKSGTKDTSCLVCNERM